MLARVPDREPGRVRVLARDHGQGATSPAGGSPRSPRPGATARRASRGSGSATGCPTTCAGTSTRSLIARGVIEPERARGRLMNEVGGIGEATPCHSRLPYRSLERHLRTPRSGGSSLNFQRPDRWLDLATSRCGLNHRQDAGADRLGQLGPSVDHADHFRLGFACTPPLAF